jgi:hypothetical protein
MHAQQPPLPLPPHEGVPPPWVSHQAPHCLAMQQLGVRRQAGGWQVVAAFTGGLSKAVAARPRANRKPVILFILCSFQHVRRGGPGIEAYHRDEARIQPPRSIEGVPWSVLTDYLKFFIMEAVR